MQCCELPQRCKCMADYKEGTQTKGTKLCILAFVLRSFIAFVLAFNLICVFSYMLFSAAAKYNTLTHPNSHLAVNK